MGRGKSQEVLDNDSSFNDKTLFLRFRAFEYYTFKGRDGAGISGTHPELIFG